MVVMAERGREGLAEFNGLVSETYKTALGWPGVYETYNEMRRRDPTLRSIVFVTKLLAKTAAWKVNAAGNTDGDKAAAKHLEVCLEGMSHTVGDFIDDCFTAIPFGWASFEIVYRRRADGRIGWKKLAYRRQSSFSRWRFDRAGGMQGWYQQVAPDYREVFLPVDKMIHVVFERDGNNPEGLSLFESAYEPWHFAKNLQIINGIGWQRSFVGLPVFDFEEDPSPEDVATVKSVGQGLQAGSKQYVSVPRGVKFELMTAANSSADAMLNTIKFYRTLMAQVALADFILLGMSGAGSYALGSDKSSMFLMAVDGFLDRIAEIWNRYGVNRLFEYNQFPGMTGTPQLTHTKIQKLDLGKLGAFVQQIGTFIPLTERDAAWAREQAGMPLDGGEALILPRPVQPGGGGGAGVWEYPGERAPVGLAEPLVAGANDPRKPLKKTAAREMSVALTKYFAALRLRIRAQAQKLREDEESNVAIA